MNGVGRFIGLRAGLMMIAAVAILGTVVPMNAAYAEMWQWWIARYNGNANGDDAATAIATDDEGNVYVTGSSISANGLDYVTVKYNAGGGQEWVARYDGTAHGNDVPHAIAVRGDYVYVTGESYGKHEALPGFFVDTQRDFATVKYRVRNGEQVGDAMRYDAGFLDDIARAIRVDDADNMFVTGSGTFIDFGVIDFVTIKYAPDGSQAWVRRYGGGSNLDDQGYAIAVDAQSNVYVTGMSMSTLLTFYDYATVKYDANGTELWTRRYSRFSDDPLVASNDVPCAIAVDSSGNVIVAGTSDATPSLTVSEYVTVKYDGSGNELWVRVYDGTGASLDMATDMVVDAAGNVYVTGTSKPPQSIWPPFQQIDMGDYVTVKYDGNGNELWVARYNGSFDIWRSRADMPKAMRLDTRGNIYVTGLAYEVIPGLFGDKVTMHDYATVMYNSDGQELWSARYSGPADGEYDAPDEASEIAIDARGRVYVTGKSTGAGTGLDYATIAYIPLDNDHDGYGENVDCNDNDASIHPGAAEVCDGIDNNCNGQIDEGLPLYTYYRDTDNDSYGNAGVTVSACSLPAGYVANALDCNDANAAVHPGAIDLPDNGIDENCDGCVDAVLAMYFRDADDDQYGDLSNMTQACSAPPGYVIEGIYDCDDSNALVNPMAAEICDGIDNNCDAIVDDLLPIMFTYYRDADNDTFGNPGDTIELGACNPPPGYVTNSLDCNDATALISPSAIEVCDGKDNNCNGAIDEGNVCYVAILCDVDKDGDIDQYDLSLISRARGQTAQPGDLRDSDGNGILSPNDVKVCIPQCTRPNCVVM